MEMTPDWMEQIRARASVLLEEPSNLSHETARNYLYLIARLERFHREVSMIRRATDDIPEFKDINRMAREALTEGEERG